MPTYAYKCQNCSHELELFQKIVDAPVKECPECKKETLQRGPGGGIGLVFAGSGWYKDNYGLKETPLKGAPLKEAPLKEAPKSSCCPCDKTEGSCKS